MGALSKIYWICRVIYTKGKNKRVGRPNWSAALFMEPIEICLFILWTKEHIEIYFSPKFMGLFILYLQFKWITPGLGTFRNWINGIVNCLIFLILLDYPDLILEFTVHLYFMFLYGNCFHLICLILSIFEVLFFQTFISITFDLG